MAPNPHYHSYLLRLWRDNVNHPWRASLQSTMTLEKHAFADLTMLFVFLVEQSAAEGDAGVSARFAAWLQAQNDEAGSHTDDAN